LIPAPPTPTLFPYTTLFRSATARGGKQLNHWNCIAIRRYRAPSRAMAILADAVSGTASSKASRAGVRLWEAERRGRARRDRPWRSEEHTSELQSQSNLVCRL